ncbi:MAG TPA: hypothetical protein VMF30_00680 [Pirellulales bacterium]|nr:hypothetical protein [Pirellulales bacterium]
MSRLRAMGACALALAILVGGVIAADTGKAPKNDPPANPNKNRAIVVGSPHEMLMREKINKILDEPTEFTFNELPLDQVVQYIKDAHHVEIQLDLKTMEEASIGSDMPVTRQLSGESLRSALRLLLRPLDLAFVIRDEVLLITTPDMARNELVTIIYPVGDLATPRGDVLGGEDFKPLIRVISKTIAPTTWDEVGGPASIEPLAQARALVISQTDDLQEQIAQLLAGLRQARDAQPAAPAVTAVGAAFDAGANDGQPKHTAKPPAAKQPAENAEKSEPDDGGKPFE